MGRVCITSLDAYFLCERHGDASREASRESPHRHREAGEPPRVAAYAPRTSHVHLHTPGFWNQRRLVFVMFAKNTTCFPALRMSIVLC